jgi:haloalkane dehalogenase
MAQPTWIDKNEYPFQSRFLDTPSGKLHYVDEGKGPVIVLVHGTPEWSFSYRELIKALRGKFRCVAFDHLGMGLSAKPADGDYSVPAHAARLEYVIETLGLKDVLFVAGDFGGSMTIAYALKHPTYVRGMIFWNTFCRDLMQDPHYSKPSKLIGTWFGKWLYRGLNFPVNFIMPRAFGDRKKLTKAIHRHYKKPLDSWAHRVATYAFATELKNASLWWERLWKQMDALKGIPILFLWGMRDQFIPHTELQLWKGQLPTAKFVEVQEAGHFVAEEATGRVLTEMEAFLAKN